MARRFFLPLIIPILFSCTHTPSTNSDIALLKNNLIEDALNLGFQARTARYGASDFSKASVYLQSMQKDGSWPDVDYSDQDNNWAPLQHLDRLIVMTINYANPSSALYENKELLNGIEKSIGFWYQRSPVCDNWYKNVIAKQFYLNVIGLLLQHEIDSNLHQKIVNDLTEKPSMTGSNRTLVSISTIYRGVLENNAERVRSGVAGVTDQVLITDKEGIQPDFSFHQHGHFIYNGSYGHNFLRESIWLATMVHGTGFAFSNTQIETLRNYYLEGTRWMIRGGLIDFNVRGRHVGRSDGDLLMADQILPQLKQFIIADPNFSDEYEKSKKLIETEQPQDIIGHKHFWRSDYSVHHSEAHLTTLKMCSERTVGIELNMNSENKLGYWLPYGLTYIYRSGDEYLGIFPAWDWARLPGVTSPHFEYEELGKGKAYTQKTSFVGGVSNGKTGISAMDFSQNNTVAKKAWFWFDEEWVALGTGIRSTHESSIVTGINQCHLRGNVIVDGSSFVGGQTTLRHPGWVLHDSIAYIFPSNQTIELKADIQSGNLRRIYGLGEDTLYSPQVFSLWFDHGLQPKNGHYAYIVAPGKSAKDLGLYAKNSPIIILENNTKIQAVQNTRLKLTGLVFYQSGQFSFKNSIVKVNEPSLVLIDEINQTVSVADPTAKLEKIQLEISLASGKELVKSLTLPQGQLAGKSVSIKL